MKTSEYFKKIIVNNEVADIIEDGDLSVGKCILNLEEKGYYITKLPTGKDIEEKYRTKDPVNVGFAYGSPNNKFRHEGANWVLQWIKENIKI